MKMAQNKVKAKGTENYMNMSIVGIIGQTIFICLATYCIRTHLNIIYKQQWSPVKFLIKIKNNTKQFMIIAI